MIPYIQFNNLKSTDFDLFVAEKGSYIGACRDIQKISIPGKNGDLIIDNGKYNNVKVSYKLSVINKTFTSFGELTRKIKAWLCKSTNYYVLTDSYEPEYFRYASFDGEINPQQEFLQGGNISINFDCKPFKYSFQGQEIVQLNSPGTITNPEEFPSKPLIKIYGNGNITLNINNDSFNLKNINEFITLDFDLLMAYKNLENLNKNVSGTDMTSFDFKPGDNQISWNGSVAKIEIIPRWCCL